MTKAYELQGLMAKFKAQGLDVAEGAAKMIITETIAWLEESAVLSQNSYDNLLLAVYPMLKKEMLAQADKIDGVTPE